MWNAGAITSDTLYCPAGGSQWLRLASLLDEAQPPANIVVGLIWAATCFGIVLTIPMVILCIFEFALWSQADSLSPRQVGGRAKTLGIFEIIVGLANTPTLICGIIVLINSGKLADRYN
jgi:hypothetical protein